MYGDFMLNINYNHLYYFQTIARLGSIKKACEELHLTQPTLSDQLRQLEESLGKKLFDRKNRSLVLNKAGKEALKYANQIFALGNELVRTLSEEDLSYYTLIEVGIVPSLSKAFAYELLMPIFENKKFKLRVKEGEFRHLLQDLSLRNLDVILSDYNQPGIDVETKNTKVGVTKYFAVASKKYSKYKKGFPKSLNELPFFHYTHESPIRSEIDHFFESREIVPDIIGEADDLNFIRVAALKSNGFSILPEIAINEYVEQKKLFKLGELKDLKSSVWAITNKEIENKGVSELIESIKT